jgi:glycosyltransferase involved in cell wall biosynthesis
MRIAVVCSDQGVRVPGDKGASIHLTSITRALQALGHEVRLYGVAGHEDPPADLDVRLLPHPGRSSGFRRELRKLEFTERFAGAFLDDVCDFAPQLVYERLALFGVAGARLAASCKALHAVEVNALLAEEEARWRGLHLQGTASRREREVLNAADLCVAVSREVEAAIRASVPGAVTTVVPNGVELELFRTLPSRNEARDLHGLARDARVVGFTGALRPWHGLEHAIRALALLDEATVLAVAGDGPARSDLEQVASSCGVASRVIWLGQMPHHRVPSFLAALDVAVAPYPALDGFAFSPLKLFEYVAAGVPIVASGIGQVRDVLDEAGAGTCVPPGDVPALAAALERSLLDPERSRSVAAAGRAYALANLGWEQRAAAVLAAIGRENDAVA